MALGFDDAASSEGFAVICGKLLISCSPNDSGLSAKCFRRAAK
jgi:hypothetical protein